jgi:hypothetical protein
MHGDAPKLMMLSFLVKLAEPIVEDRHVSYFSEGKRVPIVKECGPDDDEVENADIFKDRLKFGDKQFAIFQLV